VADERPRDVALFGEPAASHPSFIAVRVRLSSPE
jgi:hypothetical protein